MQRTFTQGSSRRGIFRKGSRDSAQWEKSRHPSHKTLGTNLSNAKKKKGSVRKEGGEKGRGGGIRKVEKEQRKKKKSYLEKRKKEASLNFELAKIQCHPLSKVSFRISLNNRRKKQKRKRRGGYCKKRREKKRKESRKKGLKETERSNPVIVFVTR